MSSKITCPQCKHQFELSEAFQHNLEEKISAQFQAKHKQELDKISQEATKKATQLAQKEIESSDKQNQQLQDQIIKLTKSLRESKNIKQKLELEFQKKLLQEEQSIKNQAKKEVEAELDLKMAEKTKKLNDAEVQIRDLQRKIQQGSQQLQGEVMELELETLLKKEFPQDKILEVKKGQRGADVIQTVVDKLGRECGTILWESKNAKWSDTWIKKLREDQRQAKAHLAVLATANPPEGLNSYQFRQGVWICTRKMTLPLAISLRFNLVHLHHERLQHIGKNEKIEVIYAYITGTEFRHRIEAMIEAYGTLQQDVEREKRWFNLKWARQEKELRKIVDSTIGLYGELQAASGRSLQPIKQLELEEGN